MGDTLSGFRLGSVRGGEVWVAVGHAAIVARWADLAN
jgi:hypothetical protein